MENRVDPRWWLLAMAAAIIGIQLSFPTEAMTVWPPLVFIIVAALLYRKDLQAYDWRALGKVPLWETTFFAVTQGMIAQAVGIVIVMYGFSIEPPPVDIVLTPTVMLSAVVFSAIMEELVYRKTLFTFLDRLFGFWPSAVVSSALFAVAHYNYSAYLGYFLLGMVWCRIYKKTENIGIVIAAHMAFNLIAMVVMALRG
jgi:membrane protease YdiL (CAAX protease family)